MASVCLYSMGMGEGVKADFINLNSKMSGEVLSP